MSHRDVLTLRDKWIKELECDDDPVGLRNRLAGMAHAIQMALSMPSAQGVVPRAGGIEILMRAVAHEIEGGPTMKNYVQEKLDIGYRYLSSE
ncbi:MAG TPA: hypothetical protein VJA87_01340 [Candidatus Paceibacterota bacterium]